jgi:hypothetical protein
MRFIDASFSYRQCGITSSAKGMNSSIPQQRGLGKRDITRGAVRERVTIGR